MHNCHRVFGDSLSKKHILHESKLDIEQLEKQCDKLEERIVCLEEQANLDQIRQNQIILCRILKDSANKILECNELWAPTSKASWCHVLNSLTRPQLIKAKIPLKYWPQMKEMLSPSTTMLSEWIDKSLEKKLQPVIEDMSPLNQKLWNEICEILNLNFVQNKCNEKCGVRLCKCSPFLHCKHDKFDV